METIMGSSVLLAVLLITCDPVALARPSREGVGDLSLPSGDLTFSLYAELSKQRPKNENLLFSPMGVTSALVELSRACKDLSLTPCRGDILAALGLRNRTEEVAEQALGALEALSRGLVDEGLTEPQLRVQSFLQLNGKRLSFGLSQGNQSSSGVAERNVPTRAGQTMSRDVELLKLPRKANDKLTLLNKVQMAGRWRQSFDSRRTLSWRFQTNATASVEVAMMYRDESAEQKMLYDTNCSTAVVQLQYADHLSALLLLPHDLIQHLEECLSMPKMKFWLSNLKSGRAEIRLPKFMMRKSYSLDQALKTSGIQGVFSPKSLQLSQALHEVELVVNESKAEGRGSSNTSIDQTVPHRITFDRPFMLIVYDEITGAVVLMGKIMDPSAM